MYPKAAIKAIKKEVGRKGGLVTGQTHSKEWLQNRASVAGTTARDMYGTDYYRHINSQRKSHRGWPKGKLRKVTKVVHDSITKSDLAQHNKNTLLGLLEANND